MILICYDGSEDARVAIERGGKLFADQRAVVLTVWEPFTQLVAHSSLGFVPMMPVEVDADRLDAAAREQAEKLAEEGAALARTAGFDARPHAVAQSGTVADAILDQAESLGADAILMGSRGLTGVRSVLMGSVSHGVVHHADRPVIVIPSPTVAAARRRGTADA